MNNIGKLNTKLWKLRFYQDPTFDNDGHKSLRKYIHTNRSLWFTYDLSKGQLLNYSQEFLQMDASMQNKLDAVLAWYSSTRKDDQQVIPYFVSGKHTNIMNKVDRDIDVLVNDLFIAHRKQIKHDLKWKIQKMINYGRR